MTLAKRRLLATVLIAALTLTMALPALAWNATGWGDCDGWHVTNPQASWNDPAYEMGVFPTGALAQYGETITLPAVPGSATVTYYLAWRLIGDGDNWTHPTQITLERNPDCTTTTSTSIPTASTTTTSSTTTTPAPSTTTSTSTIVSPSSSTSSTSTTPVSSTAPPVTTVPPESQPTVVSQTTASTSSTTDPTPPQTLPFTGPPTDLVLGAIAGGATALLGLMVLVATRIERKDKE